MVQEAYYFKLHWGNRRETPEQCAERFGRTVDGLRELDAVFGQWKQKAWTLEDAQRPFCKLPADKKELAAIFLQSRRYYDFPPDRLHPEVGFAASAWNGRDEPFGVAISVYPGSYDSHIARPNSLRLNISHRRLKTGKPWLGSELRDIMRLLIEAWGADEASVDCLRYEPESPRNQMGKVLLPQVGWLTYLSPRQLLKVTPSEGVHVERLPQGGAICTICEEPFTIDNPRHIELAEALNKAMRPIQAFPSFIPWDAERRSHCDFDLPKTRRKPA